MLTVNFETMSTTRRVLASPGMLFSLCYSQSAREESPISKAASLVPHAARGRTIHVIDRLNWHNTVFLFRPLLFFSA